MLTIDSSWRMHKDVDSDKKDLHGTGVQFKSEFYGHAVMDHEKLQELGNPDDYPTIIQACANTIVGRCETNTYKDFKKTGMVENYVRYEGGVKMRTIIILSQRTITLFHVDESRTRLIARYGREMMVAYDFLSIREVVGVNLEIYMLWYQDRVLRRFFSFIADGGLGKCECVVLSIDDTDQDTNMKQVINYYKEAPQANNAPIVPARILKKSAQAFTLRRKTQLKDQPYFFGPLKKEDAAKKLVNPGDFLFRTSERNRDMFVLNCMQPNGEVKSFSFSSEQMATKDKVFNNVVEFVEQYQIYSREVEKSQKFAHEYAKTSAFLLHPIVNTNRSVFE